MENRNTFVLKEYVFMKITPYPTLFKWFIEGIEKINISIAINLHLPVECCARACVTANGGRGPAEMMEVKKVDLVEL